MQTIKTRVRTGFWAEQDYPMPITRLQHWAHESEEVGVWTVHRAECMPLIFFPDSHIAEIRYDVEQDWRPSYWFDLAHAQVPNRSWFEWHWQRGVDPDKRRTAIPRLIRDRVMARDGLVCQICFTVVAAGDVHLDHIKPWSLGGEHSVANLRVTHSQCNMRKAAHWDGDA